jgi:hypothetical protein
MTVIIRQYDAVNATRLIDYEHRFSAAAEVARGAPGYQGSILYNSLSYPAQFIRTSVWNSIDAAWA